jgi:hypothetical protein
MALVEWPDNIAISATPPSEYFAEFMKRLSPKEREKAVFWHALPPGWETMSYEAFLEARRVRLADVVRAGFERLKSGEVVEGDESAPRSIRDLIAAGESARVEFKASARYNLHTAARDERVEHAIVKTIAGFLNSATGGTLLIGVDDDGEAVGLDNDYGLLKKKDRDGFELWLMDTLLRQLGKPATVGGQRLLRRRRWPRRLPCGRGAGQRSGVPAPVQGGEAGRVLAALRQLHAAARDGRCARVSEDAVAELALQTFPEEVDLLRRSLRVVDLLADAAKKLALWFNPAGSDLVGMVQLLPPLLQGERGIQAACSKHTPEHLFADR